MGFLVPSKAGANDGVLEGEEGMESVGVEGITRRERAGHVGGSALVSENPQVELGEEACEIWEGKCGW